MSGITRVFVLLVSCSNVVHAGDFLGAMSSEEVQHRLHNELRTLLGHGDGVSSVRLERLQARLEPLYSAMPKGADGGLDQAATRYALHRFFSQQHGWHVRGLEATGNEKWGDVASTMLEDHIPSYVLEMFGREHAGRTGLRELAVLAATLEDVVHSEAIQLLSSAYSGQGLSDNALLHHEAADRIVRTYLLFHTMPNDLYSELSPQALNHVLDQAPSFWTAWEDMVRWLQDLEETMDYDESSRENPFVEKVARTRDFNSLVRLVEGLGENYGKFQNIECREMKNTLLDLSDGSGRVRLARFYEEALAKRTSHFSESPDYLRHLGALDETDPQQPSVVVTNYMYGRGNCVASSSLYSVCCIDDCEELLARLERDVADPMATPERLAELVAVMPSDTVSAPRNISEPMLGRLGEIAARHGGKIPLHGRLFAQWMHHAFPNECAYPHVTGSLDAPLTPLEWHLMENDTGLRLQATMEEMQHWVDISDMLKEADPEAASQEPVMPWTDDEELKVGAPLDDHPAGQASTPLRFAALVLAVCSSVVALIRMLGNAPAAGVDPKDKDAAKAQKEGSVLGAMLGVRPQKEERLWI